MTAVSPGVAVPVGVLVVVGLTSIAVLCLPVLAGIVRGVPAAGPTVGVIRPALPLPATFTTMAGSLAITLVPLPRTMFSLLVSARFGRERG
ncbi:hypothetical protein [Streptomyces sp. E2N166]|uniref:hypothetical protein n=1 Tax=Streptomyces sp. E2N166 TaxID=1851909 RepID=UPI0031F72120